MGSGISPRLSTLPSLSVAGVLTHGRGRLAAAAALFLAAGLATGAASPADGTAAREQARLCEERSGEEGLQACRSALALGLGREQAVAVRQLLALRLAGQEHWEEVADVYREGVRLRPDDADANARLGAVLLFALGQAEEALSPLQEAARLAPGDPQAHLVLGVALNALGRHPQAVAAFEEALRLDPAVLEERPGARAVYEASRRGERWP